jgi:anti-sigma B factor antagonist
VPIDFARTDLPDSIALRIGGTLDVLTAPTLSLEIERIVEQRQQKVSVDLSKLDLIDSSGVAALVALYKRVRAIGGKVIVTGARDQPLAIFKLLRMDKVFAL